MSAIDLNPTSSTPWTVRVSTELQARNSRPDLFAAADDLIEAELMRAGWMRSAAA